MPLSRRILPHGKRSIANFITSSSAIGVSKLVAGSNITLSPTAGTGSVTITAGAGGGGGTVDPSTQYNVPYFINTTTLSGTSAMSYDSSSEKLELTSTQAGNASLQLQNTQATSTVSGLEIYDEGLQVLQLGHNNNTNESYLWGTGDYPLKFATSGTERMRILKDGNVGIGTTTPNHTLDVSGAISASSSTSTNSIYKSNGQNAFYYGSPHMNFYSGPTDWRIVAVDGSEVLMTLTDGGGHTGRLSLGSAAIDSAKLTVLAPSVPQLVLANDATNYFTFEADGNYLNIKANAGDKAIMSLRDNGNTYFNGDNVIFETSTEKFFQIKGTNRLEFGSEPDFGWSASGTKLYLVSGTSEPSAAPILGITQAGDVGIGTDTPTSALTVSGDITMGSSSDKIIIPGKAEINGNGANVMINNLGTSHANITFKNTTADKNLSWKFNTMGDSKAAVKWNAEGDDYFALSTTDSDPIVFEIGESEEMRLDGTGLGIGTTSPWQQLHLTGDMLVEGGDIYFGTSDKIKFKRGGTNYFDMLTSGNSAAGLRALGLVATNSYGTSPQRGTLTLQGLAYANKPTTVTGYGLVWASGTAGEKLYYREGDGTDHDLTAGGGGGGTISGSITDNQVAFGATTANSIEGSAGLQYDGTDLTISSSTSEKPQLTIRNNEDGTYGGEMRFIKDSTTPANDFLGSFNFYGRDTDDNLIQYAKYNVRSPDASAASPNGQHEWHGLDGSGNFVHQMSLINSQLKINNSVGSLSGIMYPYKTDGFGIKSIGSKMQINPGNSAAPHTGELHISAAYVGINTTSPSAFLHSEGATEQLRLGYDSSNYTSFTVAADGDLGITNNNVGIGTTSPTEVLDVRSANNTLALFKSSDNRGLIQVADDDTTVSIVAENSTLSLGLTSSISASNLNIDSAGKVGIGTTAPAKWLEIIGDNSLWPIILASGSSDHGTGIQLYNGASGGGSDLMKWSFVAGGSSNSAGPDDSLKFYNETESRYKMLITSGGNVGIGTFNSTYPFTPAGMLHVRASGAASQIILESRSATENYSTGVSLSYGTARAIRFNEHGSNATYGGYSWEIGSADAGGTEIMRLQSDGNLGIGTTSPSVKLQVIGDALFDGYLHLDKDGSPGLLVGEGGDADIYYDGTNMIFNAARVGAGKESHITTVHASGASFQKSLGEVLYLRNALNIIEVNAILQHAPNIQYVKPEPTSFAGGSVIPTELPLADADNIGLEITVVQDWSADPTAALSVQKQTGSSDVIYEGASNTASTTVSIGAYRGANKTFVIAAVGVWIVID